MYSITKTSISIETAQEIARRQFGTDSRLEAFDELKDGLYNAAYRLRLQDGLDCVLKVAPHDSVPVLRYERGLLRAEVEAIELVRDCTEIPAPRVLAYDATRSLIEHDFYIMEFLPGMPYNKVQDQLTQEEKQAIDTQTGVYLRQMNAIRGKDYGCLCWPSPRAATWREAFGRMAADILADGQEMEIALPLGTAELQEQMQAHYEVMDEIDEACLVHWDLWAGNIFINKDTKRICGMIDFERALWGDPLMEVNFGDYGQNRAFMAGYGREMVDTPTKNRRRNLYNIYLLLIMVIETYYRHYDTNDQENWARSNLQLELDRLLNKIPE